MRMCRDRSLGISPEPMRLYPCLYEALSSSGTTPYDLNAPSTQSIKLPQRSFNFFGR